MDKTNYLSLVYSIELGKKLPGATYFHYSLLDKLPTQIYQLVENLSRSLKLDGQWQLVKLHTQEFKLSFLEYPQFDSDSYPILHSSTLIDLETKSVSQRSYKDQDNPPILHRKETLVPNDYPFFEEFRLVTEEGEAAGLYEDTSIIGYKKTWEYQIKQRGYSLVDNRLFRTASVDDNSISREKTAISRFQLSSPFQALGKLGYLDSRYSVLDYGCGRGDDMSILQGEGLDVIGWDPYFRPEG